MTIINMIKNLFIILVCFFSLIFIIFLCIFNYNEFRRSSLLDIYEVPSIFQELIKGEGNLSTLMNDNEVLVCAINSYAGVDAIYQLNENQKRSLQKENLPSQDLTWYLFSFSQDSISRVYLFDTTKFTVVMDDLCVSKEARFWISKIKINERENTHVINIIKKE